MPDNIPPITIRFNDDDWEGPTMGENISWSTTTSSSSSSSSTMASSYYTLPKDEYKMVDTSTWEVGDIIICIDRNGKYPISESDETIILGKPYKIERMDTYCGEGSEIKNPMIRNEHNYQMSALFGRYKNITKEGFYLKSGDIITDLKGDIGIITKIDGHKIYAKWKKHNNMEFFICFEDINFMGEQK